MIPRRLTPFLLQDLQKKMVLLAGPRQCGKTTLAKKVADQTQWTQHYYNWDVDEDRKTLLREGPVADCRLWILDELHKYRHWKNWLKGKFDQHHPRHAFLVTGSARLDAYSRGGDSLQGRYFFHRLHPFTLAELLQTKPSANSTEWIHLENKVPSFAQKTLEDLILFGGFPEPFSSQSEGEASRWRLGYGSRLIRDEIRTLERVQDIDKMELLLDRLPVAVGSVLSINSFREDLEVAFETVRHWLIIFERLYIVFRLPPFGAPKIKAVKKEQKLYFWDWSFVEAPDDRFENLVALHLLCWIHWQADLRGEKWELRYFRDVVGHEIDFILLRKGKPWCAIEVKSNDRPLDGNLAYFLQRVRCPYAFQISRDGTKDWEPEPINGCRIRILPATRFLSHLI